MFTTIPLDLQRRVCNMKALLEIRCDAAEQGIVRTAIRHDQMSRQGDAGRAQRPDVQVMHIRDSALARQELEYRGRIDAGGDAVER